MPFTTQLREEINAAGREVNVLVTEVHLTECKRRLEEITKEAQQQLARARAGAGAGRAPARGAAANADAGAAAHQPHEAGLAAMERVVQQLPVHMMTLIGHGLTKRKLMDLKAVKDQKVPRVVKPHDEEEKRALEQLVDTLGVLVRQLYDADGVVRSGVQVELQVFEVEAGGWDKRVTPLGGTEGREGKGAGAGGKAGGVQGGAAAGRKQKGKQKR